MEHIDIPEPRTEQQVGAHTAEMVNELDLNAPGGLATAMQILVEQGFAVGEWDDENEVMNYTFGADMLDAMRADDRWEDED